MRNFILVLLFFLFCAACDKQNDGPTEPTLAIDPERYMTPIEQSEFVYSISRYICHYPSQATENNKWEQRFDKDYRAASNSYALEAYYVDSTSGRHYYMVSRLGRSIYEKYVALAGTFVPTELDPLLNYEEVFRTWKLFPEEHRLKSEMLFRKLIRGADLVPYQIQNSYPEEYIEFPDAETWYDTEARIWRSMRENVLSQYGG